MSNAISATHPNTHTYTHNQMKSIWKSRRGKKCGESSVPAGSSGRIQRGSVMIINSYLICPTMNLNETEIWDLSKAIPPTLPSSPRHTIEMSNKNGKWCFTHTHSATVDCSIARNAHAFCVGVCMCAAKIKKLKNILTHRTRTYGTKCVPIMKY